MFQYLVTYDVTLILGEVHSLLTRLVLHGTLKPKSGKSDLQLVLVINGIFQFHHFDVALRSP